MNITKTPNRTECWSKFQKCRKCCVEQKLIKEPRGYRYSSRDQLRHKYREISHLCEHGYHETTRKPWKCKGTVCKCECHGEKHATN